MEKKLNQSDSVTRRDFIKTSAAVSLAAMGVSTNRIFAAGSQKIRVGLIGCGGRGNHDMDRFLDAAKHIGLNVEVVATADWFRSRAEETGKKYGVPPERCFSGGDCYKKLLTTETDVVLLVTPPNFRPTHFEAAIKAGKHVFMEKPVAVDPPGCRRIIEIGEIAKQKGLAVVAGTQRRHQANYRRSQYAVAQGAIGKIVGGCIWWCGGALWYKTREPNESDADYMVRNWVSFSEMSGDHIVEQHVHNIDIANWFIGHPPKTALGFGGRARRKTGNQFDFFSVDLDYGDGCHIHSMCRQINGCDGDVREFFSGTEGSIWGGGNLDSAKKKDINIPDFPEFGGADVQEHIDLLNSILENKPLNEARNVAEATLAALMGRISAYTGKIVRWTDLAERKTEKPKKPDWLLLADEAAGVGGDRIIVDRELTGIAGFTITAAPGKEITVTFLSGGRIVYWEGTGEIARDGERISLPLLLVPPLYDLTLKPTAEDFEKGEVTAPKDDIVPVPGSVEKRRQ